MPQARNPFTVSVQGRKYKLYHRGMHVYSTDAPENLCASGYQLNAEQMEPPRPDRIAAAVAAIVELRLERQEHINPKVYTSDLKITIENNAIYRSYTDGPVGHGETIMALALLGYAHRQVRGRIDAIVNITSASARRF